MFVLTYKADEVRISMLENNNNSNVDLPLSRRQTMHFEGIMRKIPAGAEAAIVMVARDESFEEPVMALVRLEEATVFENFLEVPLPLRFIFVLVGPSFSDTDYHEVGRAMATLFSDEVGVGDGDGGEFNTRLGGRVGVVLVLKE